MSEVIEPTAEQAEVITPERRESELQDRLNEKKQELAKQVERNLILEAENQTLWKGYQGAGGLAALLFFGASLTKAARSFFGSIGIGKPLPRKEVADLFVAVVRRVVIVGIVGLVVASIPIWLMWEQNRLVETQNAAILEQNAKIQAQLVQQAQATQRQEADTLTVRRTQLLTLIYEKEECDLTEELAGWEKRKKESKGAFYELEPQCQPLAPLRLRQEAVIALADLDRNSLDLSKVNLSGADLSGANLSGADLSRANLSRTNFGRANLSKANLNGANLSGADLWTANLRKAFLGEANLDEVKLVGADLSGAILFFANLSKANLSKAELNGANLSKAELNGANLSKADLSGANLNRSRLYSADLTEADLSGADLSRAKLGTVIGLTQSQLSSAVGNQATKLPRSFTPPEHWNKEVGSLGAWKDAWRTAKEPDIQPEGR